MSEIKDVFSEVQAELNREQDEATKQKVRIIVKKIMSNQSQIAECSTEILKLKEELKQLQKPAEIKIEV